MAGLLGTVRQWFRGFGRRPKHMRKKRQSQTETSNLPPDTRHADNMNPDDHEQVPSEEEEGNNENDDDETTE